MISNADLIALSLSGSIECVMANNMDYCGHFECCFLCKDRESCEKPHNCYKSKYIERLLANCGDPIGAKIQKLLNLLEES